MKKLLLLIVLSVSMVMQGNSQPNFNGLDLNMGNLYRLSDAKTRSISPENFTGEKGKGGMADPADKDKPNTANAFNAARDLGQGWKVNPYVRIQPGQTFTMAEIEGPGAIQHIWMTPTGNWRYSILRIYWDDEKEPSVECPVGDFFCMGWTKYAPVNSLAVCVNPGSAFNCYWTMPFRKKCRITMENINETDPMTLYYQIDYTLTEVPADAAYFHAQYRRDATMKRQFTPLPTVSKAKAISLAFTWPGAFTTTAGGAKAKSNFYRWRQGFPHHLRNRNRRLFLRLLQLRQGREIHRVLYTLFRSLPGYPP
jgi:hypothetical protein